MISPSRILVKPGLGDAYDEPSGTFHILNQVTTMRLTSHWSSHSTSEKCHLDTAASCRLSRGDSSAHRVLRPGPGGQQGGVEGEDQQQEGGEDSLHGGQAWHGVPPEAAGGGAGAAWRHPAGRPGRRPQTAGIQDTDWLRLELPPLLPCQAGGQDGRQCHPGPGRSAGHRREARREVGAVRQWDSSQEHEASPQ